MVDLWNEGHDEGYEEGYKDGMKYATKQLGIVFHKLLEDFIEENGLYD